MPQFRAKARAVDLLGKGQIADLPTAISELWKNGYDAYGDNLEAFLYTPEYKGYKDPVFVLSDDGKGMSREDILDKWFVLGTDSKTRNEQDVVGKETLYKEPRVKMGEKGIGRLSVGYLGPQMLLLSKKRDFPLEAVFFDWRILDNYNLFLENINIPIRNIDSENHATFFQELRDEFLENFPQKQKEADPWAEQAELKEKIIKECQNLALPDYLFADFINSPKFNHPKASGTTFIVFQPDGQILELTKAFKKDGSNDLNDEQSVNHTVASLVGLFNLFKTYNPHYKTRFFVINDEGPYDLLKASEFFGPDDFDDADHSITGKFDEFGTFIGKVRIYNKTVDHTFSPFKVKGSKTNYGPFKMRLGYVQHEATLSIINEEKKKAFEDKLTLYSGLFIYRDGFRVLPYGRPDTDFLEFEERRSKGAGTYFFSKRRMFGYLEITRRTNDKLKDKSSREGFINNAAYRDFKIDLIAFFKDLAKKYFATRAEYEYKNEQQNELEKLSETAKQEHQRDIEERKKFVQRLNLLPRELEQLERELANDINLLKSKVANPSSSYDEIRPLLDRIDKAKIRYSDLKPFKPVRFKPTDIQKKKYADYQKQYAGFSKVTDESDRVIKGLRDKLKLFELFGEFEARSSLYKNTLSGRFSEFDDRLDGIFANIKSQVAKEKEVFLAEFSAKSLAVIPQKDNVEDIYNSMELLENIFNESKERLTGRIVPYLDHLERLSLEVNEDNLVGYFKDQFEEMKKEWEQTYQLAQLGIAVEIIDHQFNTLYSQLAENIKSLDDYLQSDSVAKGKYNLLVNSFNHLEDNYKLLQPLYRTTGKVPKEVKGEELYGYLSDFFNDRLKENDIDFSITSAGMAWSVFSYENIFKPVLINILNNAIFWLQASEKRRITIDAINGLLLVMNSGAKIDDSSLEDIFNLFYSERPNGRGIGLYLAKRSLKGVGFNIIATNKPDFNLLNGACFVIGAIKS
jgi:signal transduction histidine kinase